jgi:hypothetical protein
MGLARAAEGDTDVQDRFDGRSNAPTSAYTPWTSMPRISRFVSSSSETQAPLLNGNSGLSRKGPSPQAASYYYSLPHHRGARDHHRAAAAAATPCSGEAWFDHEWSSEYLDSERGRMGLDRHQLGRRRSADGVPHPRRAG